MALKDKLTNEELTKSFSNKSNFELALRAIEIAQARIASGRECVLADLLEELKKTGDIG